MKVNHTSFSLPIILICGLVNSTKSQTLPTLYKHFTEGGITSGLVAEDTREFKLNGRVIRLVSGAIHYYRIHPTQWRESLRKLRATGANTVETYIAWNMHEPKRGHFDFGEGNNDMSAFLDLRRYVEIAQEEDLLVLLRPGPYICTEWEFGGFPTWLLRDPLMRMRGSYQGYLEASKSFFEELLKNRLANLQFVEGGPIIGIQIENEYGYFDKIDPAYLSYIVNVIKTSGYDNTLLYTSDATRMGEIGSLPELLKTANLASDPKESLDLLFEFQPTKPPMVMEFWIGWFTRWFDETISTGLSPEDLRQNLDIIFSPPYNGSVNFYMFQGGTNFGFLAGGPEETKITSYDYYGALSEAGDYTVKYDIIADLMEIHELPKLTKPSRPIQRSKVAYDNLQPQVYLNFDDVLNQVPASAKFHYSAPTFMENLNMNDGNGQSYGYILHQFSTSVARNGSLLKASRVKDFATVLVDGVVQKTSFEGEGNSRYWIRTEGEVALDMVNDDEPHNITLFIESMGHVNGGDEHEYNDKKGLPDGNITLDGVLVDDMEVVALEFKSAWVKSLTGFKPVTCLDCLQAPLLVQFTFEITDEPLDTFVDVLNSGWHKGIIFVNGFNIGRYFKAGPQRRLYVPFWTLNKEVNTITIFEQLEVGGEIVFKTTPDLIMS